MEEKILLDKQTLKALVVDTRMSILKLLVQKSYTLSDISEILGLKNSTVKEHLDKLVSAGLVKKEDTDRKWKYYKLTFKGRRIIEPKEVKVLFSFIITAIAAIGVGIRLLMKQGIEQAPKADMLMAESARMMVQEPLQASINPWLYISFTVLLALSALLIGYLIKKRQIMLVRGEKR